MPALSKLAPAYLPSTLPSSELRQAGRRRLLHAASSIVVPRPEEAQQGRHERRLMDCRDSSAVVLKMDINLSHANLNVSYVQKQVCLQPQEDSSKEWL